MASALTRLEVPGVDLVTVHEAEFKASQTITIEDVFDGPATLFGIVVNNTANAAQAEYVKVYDAVSITLGTTAPDYVFKVAAAGPAFIPFNLPGGVNFTNGVTIACVTGAGTAGTTGPTAAVPMAVYGKRN